MDKFLYADKGKKECSLDVSVQHELKTAIRELAGSHSMSGYVREILIAHVRKQKKKGNL